MGNRLTKRRQVAVGDVLWREVLDCAEKHGVSASEWVRSALERGVRAQWKSDGRGSLPDDYFGEVSSGRPSCRHGDLAQRPSEVSVRDLTFSSEGYQSSPRE